MVFELTYELTQLLIIVLVAGVLVVILSAVLARRRSKAKNKNGLSEVKWSALVDWRGLVVEAQGPADRVIAAYAVQAAKVLEEVGKLTLYRAQLSDITLEVKPTEEEGLYRVVAR